jgi:hypothetical protein
METKIHQKQLNNVFQKLNQLNLLELDEVMNRIVGLRKQKLPNVLTQIETDLLRKINYPAPAEIQRRYDFLIKKRKNESLKDAEYQELIELTAYFENQNVQRLSYLIELAKLRNVSLDELIEQLELKPRFHVA